MIVIREIIKEINASYQDLEMIEWIPLPSLYKGNQLLVDYQELLGYEATKQKVFFQVSLENPTLYLTF